VHLITTAAGIAIFLGGYIAAATVLWGAARLLAPLGRTVEYRRVALAVALMLPLDFAIPYLVGHTVGDSWGLPVAFGVDAAIIVALLRLPVLRSLIAAIAYEATLFGWVFVLGLMVAR